METVTSMLDNTVAALLERYPQTTVIFMRHHMACVGCAIIQFETVGEALAIYHMDPERFVREVNTVIRNNTTGSAAPNKEETP